MCPDVVCTMDVKICPDGTGAPARVDADTGCTSCPSLDDCTPVRPTPEPSDNWDKSPPKKPLPTSPPTVTEDVISRVQRRMKKWSTDLQKNREILSNPTKFAGILDDMSEDVTKLQGTIQNVVHEEKLKVSLRYKKYSDRSLPEEFVNCNMRPLVSDCNVTSAGSSRRLAADLILYGYDVAMEGSNATEMAIAAVSEVVAAESVDRVNLTAISDQVLTSAADEKEQEMFDALSSQNLNISVDDYFIVDYQASGDVYLLSGTSDPCSGFIGCDGHGIDTGTGIDMPLLAPAPPP